MFVRRSPCEEAGKTGEDVCKWASEEGLEGTAPREPPKPNSENAHGAHLETEQKLRTDTPLERGARRTTHTRDHVQNAQGNAGRSAKGVPAPPTGWLKSKAVTSPHAGGDAEKRGRLCIDDGWENGRATPERSLAKPAAPTRLGNVTPGHFAQGSEDLGSHRGLPVTVPDRSICHSPKPDAARGSFCG